ncbi:MAG: hypothetical protein R3F21_20915 [Myxococcota bacterium]
MTVRVQREGLRRAFAARMIAPIALAAFTCAACAPPASAADPEADAIAGGDAAEAPRRVVVAASERYQASRVHRFVLGGGYRDLWETPIELPVLDLEREAGGLVPTGRFGGLQTPVLGFEGGDGRRFSFRGTDKDPSAVLDTLLHDTLVQAVVQDQMAAQHPGGPPVANELTAAAGVLTVHERLVVMPDDPRLGEFRREFAGMVGTFFEYPQPASEAVPGFHGAREILDHEALYEALAAGDSTRVDVRAFLRARLLDLLLGDFDRHRKQWRWAELERGAPLQPIPEDRDMAFVRYDGLGPRIMKVYVPILQRYDADYPFIKGLTLHGWEQDRWLLPALAWDDWAPIVADVQARLDDATIDRAIERLPPEYVALDGARLAMDIRGRRDGLADAARRFYAHLARAVDVQTSDAAHSIRVTRGEGGRTRITVVPLDGSAPTVAPGAVLFDREFRPDETKEIRIYLRGGDDDVVVTGGRGAIRLHLIAGDGAKQVDDREGGGTRVHDAAGSVRVLAGRGTRVDRAPYTPPPSDAGFVDVENVPPRDWGSDTIPIPEFGYEADVGAYLGIAVAHTRYGFRKHPWSDKHNLAFGWATEANEPRLRYEGRFRPENSKLLFGLDLHYSGIDVLRFYGEGNETRDRGNDRFFRVRNEQYAIMPSVEAPLDDSRIRLSGGPYARFSRTFNGTRLIDELDPYGNHHFGLIGAEGSFTFDTRRSLETKRANLELPFHANPAAGYPTSGLLFEATAQIQPPVWDVEKTYGSIRGALSGYLSFFDNARMTLALRAGGQQNFGRVPYFDLAYVGGGRFFSGASTDRGFRTRRFAGDASVYGNADLRVVLFRPKIIVPGDFGIQGFADVGRVFLDDEDSDEWHPSGGAGVWFSPLVRTNTISLSVAHSPEDTLAYFRFGFHY